MINYYDFSFRPTDANGLVCAIQAVDGRGNVIGRASLIKGVWAYGTADRPSETMPDKVGAVQKITRVFEEALAREGT